MAMVPTLEDCRARRRHPRCDPVSAIRRWRRDARRLEDLAARIAASFDAPERELDADAVEETIGLLDAARCAWRSPTDDGLDRQRVGEAGRAALLPRARSRDDRGRSVRVSRQAAAEARLRGRRVSGSCPLPTARYGAFLSPGVVLMPSYVNIGAWVGPGTMVDTWATVGSCAQIGADVHLSGGVGIGGVLEPLQAAPVIVEDGAFIGSRVRARGGRPRAARGRDRAGRGPHRQHPGDRRDRRGARRASRRGARACDRDPGLAPARVPRRAATACPAG